MSRQLVGALALFLVFTLGGCEESAGVGGSGSLSILLTDDPGFLEAWVNIRRVELVGGGEGEGEGGGIVVLRDDVFEANLLDLANDVAILVDETTVPEGTYSQLRFIIPDACIVLGEVVDEVVTPTAVYASPDYDRCDKTGITPGDLQLPSFDQTGIKVQLPNDVLTVSGEQTLLVDFDVLESFGHQAGNSGKWVMHPVIRAEDMSLSGTITVELTLGAEMSLPTDVFPNPTLADYFQASLDTETEPVLFTESDGTYKASFLHLLPDQSYEVSVVLKEGLSLDFAPMSPQTVNFESENVVTVSFVVNPPTEP